MLFFLDCHERCETLKREVDQLQKRVNRNVITALQTAEEQRTVSYLDESITRRGQLNKRNKFRIVTIIIIRLFLVDDVVYRHVFENIKWRFM